MKTRKLTQILIVALFGAVISGCAGLPAPGGGLKPSKEQFSSQWVDISMGGMMGIPGEGLVLGLDLGNKSPQTLYVQVAFVSPDPEQRCEITKQLDASKHSLFTCAQKSLTPNQDYPIEISIYSDEARTNLLESPRTKFYFSESDVRVFEELAKRYEADKPE